MVLWIVLSIVVVMAIVGIVFVNQPSFGRIPRGERLARIERSPNYRDGAFRNIHETPLMTSDKGRLQGLLDFVFKDKTGLQPDTALTVVKTDLRQINPEEDVLVWFGHSSYLVQVDGKRVLVDPVFCMASPVSFINKPFKEKRNTPTVVTYTDSMVNKVWQVVGTLFSLTVLVMLALSFIVGRCDFTLMLPLCLLYASIGTAITGLVIREKCLLYLPFVGFVFAIYMLMSYTINNSATILWNLYFGLSFVVMMIIPGHILNNKSEKL